MFSLVKSSADCAEVVLCLERSTIKAANSQKNGAVSRLPKRGHAISIPWAIQLGAILAYLCVMILHMKS